MGKDLVFLSFIFWFPITSLWLPQQFIFIIMCSSSNTLTCLYFNLHIYYTSVDLQSTLQNLKSFNFVAWLIL